MLYATSFRFYPLQLLFIATELVIQPFLWSCDQLASVFLPITPEKDHLLQFIIKNVILIPLCAVILVIDILPASVAFLLRCLLHYWRAPYTLSVSHKSLASDSDNQAREHIYPPADKISITTTNVCLLPECLARFNNLSHSSQRSRKIGERIVVDQYFYQNMMKTSTNLSDFLPNTEKKTNGLIEETHSTVKSHVASHFPRTDFLCLQETWYRSYSRILISELHKVFPWILYDAGITCFSSNNFLFNSGLMFASRYPILDADFKFYRHSCKQCVFNSKGLLMAKVQVSYTKTESKVGYIFTTHLQAYQGEQQVIKNQLDDIVKWTEEFRKATACGSDIVLFDIVCGDFNFDNMSPGEQLSQNHPIFSIYEDFGRIKSGQDKDWTIGTEMRQKYLWDKQISTPEGLKEALQDPIWRQRYIVDADIEIPTLESICNSEPKCDEEGKMSERESGGRRRIDYVLYNKNCAVDVENYRFITRLATLTDHIPVCMEFSCRN